MIDIVAINITNLTDARYFAARGASWIFYLLRSEQEIPRIKEISAWIDGPRLGLSFGQDMDEHQIRFAIDNLKPEGIISEGEQEFEGLLNFYLTDDTLQSISGKEKIIQKSGLDNNCTGFWIYLTTHTSTIGGQLKIFKPKAIVFSGTAEDQTGVKNYDSYDEILDTIEMINYP